jgi:murein L,D-transpeptidase YcbB/YkuD
MTSIGLRPGLVLAILLLGAVPAPGQAQTATPAPAPTAVVQANPAAEALARHLSLGTGTTSERAAELLVVLAQFYQERQMAPLWLGADGPNDRARALAAVLRDAGQDGLDPEDYDARVITGLLAAGTPDQRAELELRLSVSLLEITSDLGAGRLEPHQVNPELFIHPPEIDPAKVIRDAAGVQDIAAFVAGFEPAQPEYRRLKAALADYRALAAAGGWPSVADGPTLKPDMAGPRVAQLRARLDVPAAAGADPAQFDPALVEAVKAFQARHGLEQDGLIGQNTLAELNVPAQERVRQILLNLERRRWMADNPGERYVFVNLADFELKVVDGPRTVFDTRVVVGAPYHRTPVFSGEMTYLELNPYWNVPPSIARKELLPKIKADPGYLAANNFELLSDWSESATVLDPHTIDWSAVTPERFTYKLRQGPGPGNALGFVKFMFPNQFNIYLHDTPARGLFARDVRDFSHGCIRVQDPETFGSFVLDRQPGWSLDAINAAIATGKRQIVSLEQPLPVHIAYLTAWVNKDGSVNFRRDVYGRDAILAAALLGPQA